jgi:hypothetical protein
MCSYHFVIFEHFRGMNMLKSSLAISRVSVKLRTNSSETSFVFIGSDDGNRAHLWNIVFNSILTQLIAQEHFRATVIVFIHRPICSLLVCIIYQTRKKIHISLVESALELHFSQNSLCVTTNTVIFQQREIYVKVGWSIRTLCWSKLNETVSLRILRCLCKTFHFSHITLIIVHSK